MPSTIPVTAQVQGHTITCQKRDLEAEDDDAGLAWFDFESENSIASATGTLIWDASFFFVDLLNDSTAITPDGRSLSELIRGRRVLELGAGIGLVSLCSAAAGAHVLCTDLPAIVDGILARNILANTTDIQADSPEASKQQASQPWPGSRVCGQGSITSAPLDFCRPLVEQVYKGCDPRTAEVVLAADIVWLKELVQPLAQTIRHILTHNPTVSSPVPTTTEATAGASNAGHAAHADKAESEADSEQQQSHRTARQPQIGSSDLGCHAHMNGTPSSTHTHASQTPVPHTSQQAEPSEPIDTTKPQSTGSDENSHSSGSGKVAFIAFGERASPTSTLFISLEEVCEAFRAYGCTAEVAVRRVMEREPGERMPVVLLRITAV